MDDEQKNRARLIQRELGDVLQRDWDPIGVGGDPEVSGEYEAYVGGVYRLLASEASVMEIAAHLSAVEGERFGFFDREPKMLIPVAQKLQQVYSRFNRQPAV